MRWTENPEIPDRDGVDPHMYRKDLLDRKDEIIEWMNEGLPFIEIARRLNCARDTATNFCKNINPNYKGNQNYGQKGKTSNNKKTVIDLLKNPRIPCSRIRERLIEEGYKERKCEVCGLTEWMGLPIPLELHHKDFNHWNNDINNLQIICCNCHMQKHNYSNIKK